MRIVAGIYSSRRLIAPDGISTRPTLDKVREAVFSSLGGSFEGGVCLDLYAGSGAVGLEALSRGMDRVVLVDQSRKAVEIIRKNTQSLKAEDRVQILCMKDTAALKLLQQQGVQMSLVYLDPPYAKQHNEEVIRLLDEYKLLKPGADVVVESAKEDINPEQCGGLTRRHEALYGISRITYYRKVM
ncbi:MAG: 16S rRNA (guanine(966)-N(2))-methyltransferase RsmD [Erysipelotrichia bacterium]|nr:16S rRNA (guanine(966)-N(2))-methyltransferase RsmD [Erysipelotrichia bacterium]